MAKIKLTTSPTTCKAELLLRLRDLTRSTDTVVHITRDRWYWHFMTACRSLPSYPAEKDLDQAFAAACQQARMRQADIEMVHELYQQALYAPVQ